MHQHHLVHDAQAQTRAAGLPAAGLVHPVEAVEDMSLILPGDAGAVVGDGHHRVPAGADQPHLDGAALLRILDGVFHQVVHHLCQFGAVGVHFAAVVQGQLQFLMMALGHGLETMSRIGDDLRQAEGGAVQAHGLGVHAHQRQKVADDAV